MRTLMLLILLSLSLSLSAAPADISQGQTKAAMCGACHGADGNSAELPMLAQKTAFDPSGLLNPGKVIPTLHRCAEYGRMHVKKGLLPFPELERF